MRKTKGIFRVDDQIRTKTNERKINISSISCEESKTRVVIPLRSIYRTLNPIYSVIINDGLQYYSAFKQRHERAAINRSISAAVRVCSNDSQQ